MLRIALLYTLLAFAPLAHASQPGSDMLFTDHPLVGKIWDVNRRSFIDEATLYDKINASDVLLLGEIHDNAQHHELEQKLLKARIESGARPALMMEQLNSEDQQTLDQDLAGSDRPDVLKRLDGLIKFSNWQAYSPLLAIAFDNKLPVIAANVPSQRLHPAVWHGYETYGADEIKRLAVERVWSDSRQNYLVTHMGGVHCGELRDELRTGLARSQRLRDAYMVDSAISSIGRGIVAVVGRDHARRDIGMPLYFAARAPSARVLSLAFVEVAPGKNDPRDYEAESASGDAPYDVVWFTARSERTNPCANFGKPKQQ